MKIKKQDDIQGQLGYWVIEAYDAKTGEKVDHIEGKNLITTDGKELVLDLLAGINGATNLTGLATGTNNAAANLNDVAITNEQFKLFETTPTREGLTTTYEAFYGPDEGNINIQELGMLTTSGGVLFNRIAPVGPFNKTSAVSIRITVTITQQ